MFSPEFGRNWCPTLVKEGAPTCGCGPDGHVSPRVAQLWAQLRIDRKPEGRGHDDKIMEPIPLASHHRGTYENFEATCPTCGVENVFNRVSDLKTLSPIAGREVICQNAACQQPFWISHDMINPAFEMLLFDCDTLARQKRFMHCVLTVTQAYEVFFASFVRVRLLYRPFVRQRTLEVFNRLSRELYERVHDYTFDPMRNLFFRLVIDGTQPADLNEARLIIEALPERPPGVKKEEINGKTEPPLTDHLLVLFDTRVNEVRNMVVHKDAYRPSAEHASQLVEEARSILYPLNAILGPLLDFEHYANAPME